MDQGATNGNKKFLMEVIREGEVTMVKPSEETEKGFYFLSNLDQNMVSIMKNVYLYESSPGKGNEEAVEVIRESLAKVLVPYHPMAGRLALGEDGKVFVNLTGEGAAFMVADASVELGEFLAAAPHLSETLLKFVYDFEGADVFQTPLIVVQVTKFKCGGFAIGTCMNHSLCDGISAVEFLNSWGHVARHGLPLPAPPALDRSSLKARDPPRAELTHPELLEIDDVSNCGALYEAEPMEYKSFVFDEEKIGRLKGKAMEGEGGVIKCSTFEVLSVFVWKAWSKALRMLPHQRTRLYFAVDVRPRMNPPLPKGFFGNGIWVPCAISTTEELLEEPLSSGVKRIKETIGMVTDEYMRSAIDHFENTRVRPLQISAATLVLSAWSKLMFHYMDFGWGEAVFSGPTGLPIKEAAVFLPHGTDRKAIRVYLSLPVSALNTFEQLVMEI